MAQKNSKKIRFCVFVTSRRFKVMGTQPCPCIADTTEFILAPGLLQECLKLLH